jgi:hypothetical protein
MGDRKVPAISEAVANINARSGWTPPHADGPRTTNALL